MFSIVPLTVLLWLSVQAEQPRKAAQLRHNSLPHAAALPTSHYQVKIIHRTWEETHRNCHRGLPQIYIGCEGILYYCSPAYCSNNINNNNNKKKLLQIPGTKIPCTGHSLFKVWPRSGRSLGRGLPPTQLATLSLGFLWLSLSAALVIAASVDREKQSRACAPCMRPAGRGQLRRDPGPAPRVREASPMAWGFSPCLLLPSPAQILHTLGSGIMNQWLACSSAVPKHLSQLRALPGALSRPSPVLVSGKRGGREAPRVPTTLTS